VHARGGACAGLRAAWEQGGLARAAASKRPTPCVGGRRALACMPPTRAARKGRAPCLSKPCVCANPAPANVAGRPIEAQPDGLLARRRSRGMHKKTLTNSEVKMGRYWHIFRNSWAYCGRGNHKNIFTDCGVEWREYRYFDKATIGLDFEGMTADLEAAPDGSVVVLHGARGRLMGPGRVPRHACGSSAAAAGRRRTAGSLADRLRWGRAWRLYAMTTWRRFSMSASGGHRLTGHA